MARCVSFVRLGQHTAALARCVRRARAGDIFCTSHRDAINGVMMGILHHSEPYHVNQAQIEETCLEAGTGRLALESVIASLNVPTGHTIRPVSRRLRKIRAQRKQKRETRRARNAGRSGGKEAATAAATAKARGDRRRTA
jgi:hypothetical protein